MFLPRLDQFRNAQTAKWHGYGEILCKNNLTKEAIVDAIKGIIGNTGYRQKAREMAKILNSKPVPAEDLFIKYTEFATKFDLHPYLDMQGRHLNTVEYYNLDILFCIFVIISVVMYLLYRLVRTCCRISTKTKKNKTE